MSDLDFVWLMKIRLAVARCGEMDLAKWWNTNGQLGSFGARMLSRGLPRTHHFAQAKSVFAVAAHRCAQIFNPPECATFWHLTDGIEDEFDARWEGWLDEAADWKPFFERVAAIQETNAVSVLLGLDLVSPSELEEAKSLKRSAERNSVPLPNAFSRDRASVAKLALGFGLSGVADLAVPYARRDPA
jgi:hypothetical protein